MEKRRLAQRERERERNKFGKSKSCGRENVISWFQREQTVSHGGVAREEAKGESQETDKYKERLRRALGYTLVYRTCRQMASVV